MTVLRQTPNERCAPILSIEALPIVTSSAGTSSQQHRWINFTRSASTSYHNKYAAKGASLPVQIVSQDPANALDISDWPTVTRNPGINSRVEATFSNSRATSSIWTFDMRSFVGESRDLPPDSAVADSYFEYSYNAVKAIADALATNSMWDSSGNRAQTGIIPHQAFTGQVWTNTGWGVPGVSNGGRRFMAITRRHLFGCGHYQYYPGDKLYWKDVNNNVIERTVIHVVNINTEMQLAGLVKQDMSITLIDSDLPESITILPVTGDWGRGIIAHDSDEVTICKQAWGFALLNNDGHINPFCADALADTVVARDPVTFEGITFDRYTVQGISGYYAINGMENWDSGDNSGKFHHHVRGGDSGTPCVIPVAGGWAYSGHISFNHHPSAEVFDQLIDLIDSRAVAAGVLGSPTNYSVTVAPDPTL